MEVFKELKIKFESDIEGFKNVMLNKKASDWKVSFSREFNAIEFEYLGNKFDAATIFLTLKLEDCSARVSNIVPTKKFELSIREYNALLDEFYKIFLSGLSMAGVTVCPPTSELFDPLTVISKEALNKLVLFCNCANKSTGSSHPLDRERWLEFIYQTLIDGNYFDPSLLQRFLQDEDFWGKKDSWVMGKSAWSQEKASELALQYESLYEAMAFCKERLDG